MNFRFCGLELEAITSTLTGQQNFLLALRRRHEHYTDVRRNVILFFSTATVNVGLCGLLQNPAKRVTMACDLGWLASRGAAVNTGR